MAPTIPNAASGSLLRLQYVNIKLTHINSFPFTQKTDSFPAD